MRFVYGLIFGLLAAIIAAILYLAVGGGQYLLVLSPTYHEMKTRLDVLGKAEEQRNQLAGKLEALEQRFGELAKRFEELRGAAAGNVDDPAGPAVNESSGSEPATP